MATGYSSYQVLPHMTIEARQARLYLGVVSMGESLYQKGAAIAEMNKEFMAIEKELDAMRAELRDIRGQINENV